MNRLIASVALFVAVSAKGSEENLGKATFNGKLEALLISDVGEQQVDADVSAFLRMDELEMSNNKQVALGGFNVRFHSALQELFTGESAEKDEDRVGTATFSLAPTGKPVFLMYDEDRRTLTGHVAGILNTAAFSKYVVKMDDKGEDGDIDTANQEVELEVSISLSKSLKGEPSAEPEGGLAKLNTFRIVSRKDNELFNFPKIQVELIAMPFPFEIQIVWWPLLEVAKQLCIQPVRIGTWRNKLDFSFSGTRFPTHMIGANKQWNKADVIFEVRAWKNVWSNSLSTLTEDESPTLRATVDDEDCIEVFYVDRFSPTDMWGGGACFGGGSAGSKIIMTDEKVHETVLAHELGHTMTLKHPGQGYPKPGAMHRIDGSSGTCACPSGFYLDNPKKNSQHNKDSIQNPLFKYTIKVVSGGVDCQNDADCGGC